MDKADPFGFSWSTRIDHWNVWSIRRLVCWWSRGLSLGEFHLHPSSLGLIGLGVPVPVGIQEKSHKAQDEDGEHETDDGRD